MTIPSRNCVCAGEVVDVRLLDVRLKDQAARGWVPFQTVLNGAGGAARDEMGGGVDFLDGILEMLGVLYSEGWWSTLVSKKNEVN